MSPIPVTAVVIIAICAALVLIALTAWMLTPYRRREFALKRAVRQIGEDVIHDLVVPDGVDGEILIHTLLLTRSGLLVLEIKRVDGKVFGGEQLDHWTAIAQHRRVQFPNPVALLKQRMIALRSLYPDVPVDGRVVIVGDAKLGADLPALVTDVAGLRNEFAAGKKSGGSTSADAYHEHWNELRRCRAA